MDAGSAEKGLSIIGKVVGFFPKLKNRAATWIIYRAAGIPRRAVSLVTHQLYRPFWTIQMESRERMLYARCDWYVRSLFTPVSIVGVHIGKRGEWQGIARTWTLDRAVREKMLNEASPVHIEPGHTAEIECDFWIVPPPVKEGEPLIEVVTLVDDFGNHYSRRLRFDYEKNPALRAARLGAM